MISEADVDANFFIEQLPQAPPGISGRLISKCKKLRRSYMANPDKMAGSPCVYKIGSQVYVLRWFGTDPAMEPVNSVWQNAYFVRRKEVSIEDQTVQEALAASFVMLRMDQKRAVDQTGWYGSSPLYAQSSNPYQYVTASVMPSSTWGTWSSSNTYATSPYPYGTSYAQSSGNQNLLKKILGIP